MTVGGSSSRERSLRADAPRGLPRVRRLADVAWAGGALPIIVVAGDPEEKIAKASPAPPSRSPSPPRRSRARSARSSAGSTSRSPRSTRRTPRSSGRPGWSGVGPETVTSLIEAHGLYPGEMLRPSWDAKPGWPALLPVGHVEALRALPADRMPDGPPHGPRGRGRAHAPARPGRPGHDVRCAHDAPRTPRTTSAPTAPTAGHVHEWGAAAAETPEDAPLSGPARAPLAARPTDPPGFDPIRPQAGSGGFRRVPAPRPRVGALHDERPRAARRRG